MVDSMRMSLSHLLLGSLLSSLAWSGVTVQQDQDEFLRALQPSEAFEDPEPELMMAREEVLSKADQYRERSFRCLTKGVALEEDGSVSGSGKALLPEQREFLFEVLVHGDHDDLRTYLAAEVKPTSGMIARRTAFAVVGRFGLFEDLEAAMRLIEPEANRPGSSPLGKDFEGMVTEVCRRDPDYLGRMRDLISISPEKLRKHLIHGLSLTGDPDAMQVFARLLFESDPNVQPALEGVGRLVLSTCEPVPDRIADSIERLLWTEDPVLLQTALRTAGLLGEPRFAQRILEIALNGNAGSRSAAVVALRFMSGLRFGDDPELWSSWLERETTWWSEEWDEQLTHLRSADPVEIVSALSEVAHHALYRSEIAPEVVFLLEHDDPIIRRLACYCLAELRAYTAAEPLAKALDDFDPSVAHAACGALGRILASGAGSDSLIMRLTQARNELKTSLPLEIPR